METPRARPGRWSPLAREVLDRAGKEARDLGHDHVGTEHALLALASTEGGLAAEVLASLGVAPERMLATDCMKPAPHDHELSGCMPLMPRFKQALEHSRRIADGLGAGVADTEHLLAGILAVPDSMAVEILRRLKVRPKTVRANLAERLGVDPRRLDAPTPAGRRWLKL